jgi:hypothetical protein
LVLRILAEDRSGKHQGHCDEGEQILHGEVESIGGSLLIDEPPFRGAPAANLSEAGELTASNVNFRL